VLLALRRQRVEFARDGVQVALEPAEFLDRLVDLSL
jgi:hypothetical protein